MLTKYQKITYTNFIKKYFINTRNIFMKHMYNLKCFNFQFPAIGISNTKLF